MPKALAISFALAGPINPPLFSPSVSNITTLLLLLLLRNLSTLVANPSPIEVPSSSNPLWIPSTAAISTGLSVVSGHWVKLSPEKITIPIRSVILLSIKSMATFLAASMRLGKKSCAVMLPLTSRHKIISKPSPSACCSSVLY